jgi:hypothetical protein
VLRNSIRPYNIGASNFASEQVYEIQYLKFPNWRIAEATAVPKLECGNIAGSGMGGAVGFQRGSARAEALDVPRMSDGKSNLTGMWQTLGTPIAWDIQDHSPQAGPLYQLVQPRHSGQAAHR